MLCLCILHRTHPLSFHDFRAPPSSFTFSRPAGELLRRFFAVTSSACPTCLFQAYRFSCFFFFIKTGLAAFTTLSPPFSCRAFALPTSGLRIRFRDFVFLVPLSLVVLYYLFCGLSIVFVKKFLKSFAGGGGYSAVSMAVLMMFLTVSMSSATTYSSLPWALAPPVQMLGQGRPM